MFNPPPQKPPMIQICKKEIELKTCKHLNSKNVNKDLILYKKIDDKGDSHFFGTCSICYLTNNSKRHTGNNDD